MQIQKALVAISCLIFMLPAHAYDFVPTDVEWQSWPGYCQAKYIWTNIGRDSKFRQAVGPGQKAELEQWESAGIYGLHHFCAGKSWLGRAKTEADATRKAYMLRSATNETDFTARGSDRTAPQFSEIVLLQALILFEQKDVEGAIKLLQQRIGEYPSTDVLYSATAVMQRKQGRLDEARATLIQGYEFTDGKSAEINYNLGLVSLELGNVVDARKFAEQAYELGYPLPGLRLKLARLDNN